MRKAEFDVFLAGVNETGAYRTKIHEIEALYPSERSTEEESVLWQYYSEQLKQRLREEESVGGVALLEWIKQMRQNGSITNLDDWMTAVNLALVDDPEMGLEAHLGGLILLTRSQLSAGTYPAKRDASDEEMDIVAFSVNERQDGGVEGRIFCFDTVSGRVGLVSLSQEQLTVGMKY